MSGIPRRIAYDSSRASSAPVRGVGYNPFYANILGGRRGNGLCPGVYERDAGPARSRTRRRYAESYRVLANGACPCSDGPGHRPRPFANGQARRSRNPNGNPAFGAHGPHADAVADDCARACTDGDRDRPLT